ncbi:MAG: Y-family DNA polymerase [Chloroflexota bacterium]
MVAERELGTYPRPLPPGKSASVNDGNAPRILHFDLDAFFAAVEVILNPSLAGLPLIIGGRPEARGVVSPAPRFIPRLLAAGLCGRATIFRTYRGGFD